MKSIRDLIPKRRPTPGAASMPAPDPAAAPPAAASRQASAEVDLAADLRDKQRAQSGRDRVPVANKLRKGPQRQTMEDVPKDVIAVSTRPKTAADMTPPAMDAPDRDAPGAAPAIWDLEGGAAHDLPPQPSAPTPAAPPAVAEAPAMAPQPAAAPDPSPQIMLNPPREGAGDRVRTRLMGFGAAPQADAFAAAAAQPDSTRFPIGWLALIEGPGRGASFTLTTGLSTIGRGQDQAVRLDFGDTAISRECHAAIVYDPEDRRVLIGHGGRSNIVRLNGEPLLSREELHDGDLIRLGKTTLCFVAFCGPDFDWQDGQEEADG